MDKGYNSFTECEGNIIHKEDEIIHGDMGMGSYKKILPSMIYNIFEDETDLITEASVRNLLDMTSKAKM